MSPILLLLLVPPQAMKPVPKGPNAKATMQKQVPKASGATNRFLTFVRSNKELSVHMTLHRPDRQVDGQADLILQQPDKLFYHITWGPEEYTYVIRGGQATEVDKSVKLYDEYPLLTLQPPEANGSPWIDTCFPVPFVSDQITLPEKSVDESGHLIKFGFADEHGIVTTLTFTDYKTNQEQPESKFALVPPSGFTAYAVQRLAPPVSIGEPLPDISLSSTHGESRSLKQILGGKPALIAVLDPKSEPSVGSLSVLRGIKGVPVIVVNTASSAGGLDAGSLPEYLSQKGEMSSEWRVGLAPLFYMVDASGKVTNVWYGFDRDAPDKFATEINDAVSEVTGS